MSIEIRDSVSLRPSYELGSDAVAGMKSAVNNGQTRLALEYTVNVIAQLQAQIEHLENRLDKVEEFPVIQTNSSPPVPIIIDENMMDTTIKTSKRSTKVKPEAE